MEFYNVYDGTYFRIISKITNKYTTKNERFLYLSLYFIDKNFICKMEFMNKL